MTQLAVTGRSSAPESGIARLTHYFWPIAAALFFIRIFLDARYDLVPDEAFYWTWTRHLNTGYYDHPPMIAWLIWLSTRVLGDTPLGVRMLAAAMSIGSLAVLFLLARRLLGDARAVGWVLLMWIAAPLLPVLGAVSTPDAPSIFFSMCALACAVIAIERDDDPDDAEPQRFASGAFAWLGFGIFSGLAVLSKYTAVLVPVGVALALLTRRQSRRHLRRPWVYLAALAALAVFSPNIYWNAKHDWASYLFQLHHGAGGGMTRDIHNPLRILLVRLGGLGQFIGGQALVWTPILFLVTITVLIANWLKAFRSFRKPRPARIPHRSFLMRGLCWIEKIGGLERLRGTDWMLLWTGTLPLLVFGWAATRSHGELNWPAFAYFPLSLLVGRYLSENLRGNRIQWIRKGCEVAIGFTLAVHLIVVPSVQQWISRRGIHLTHQVTDLWGWQQYGRQLAEMAQGIPVICNRHQDAGEAAFYMPGQPDVWCEGIGSRKTSFDYYDRDRPDYQNMPEVLFVGGNLGLFMAKFGYVSKVATIRTFGAGVAHPIVAARVRR